MGSSIIRFICRKGAAGILKRNFGGGGRLDGGRMMASATNPSKTSPWLMLPPAYDKSGGGMVYRFYSLADDEVLSFEKSGAEEGAVESPDDDARVVGSSHGWLALLNRRNNDLFLSNPLSRRHIKLPPIDALPNPEINLRNGLGSVSKVIVSTSPDDDDCRAMMSFGPGDRLAFCRPGRSAEWTPIGQLFLEREDSSDNLGRVYEDFVYSSRRKIFKCMAIFDMLDDDFILEDWDLRDAHAPMIDGIQEEKLGIKCGDYKYRYKWLDDEKVDLFLSSFSSNKHLVYSEQSDQLFMLFRYMVGAMGPDGSSVQNHFDPVKGYIGDLYPYKTVGFIVAQVVKDEGGKTRLVGCSLDGLALFVGINHSFALSTEEFPELKSNSIYFTDNKGFTPPDDNVGKTYGGHDIGIFDCGDGSFSSCYYPCDYPSLQRIVPAPLWFTPTLS